MAAVSVLSLVLVATGGAVGALGRFLVDRALAVRDQVLPWGTVAVNITGSALFGVLAGLGTALPGPVWYLVGLGFCGALTTWSTFAYETLRLLESGARGYALLNVGMTLAIGLSAASLGWLMVSPGR